MLRFPVLYKGKCYMPMKLSRCLKFVREGKAKFKYYPRLRIKYLELKFKPSNNNFQNINLGWDLGSHFCGVSLVSPKYHHCNFEIIHNRKVKDLMGRRRDYRRIRRSRLRHRKIRFDNRTSSQISATNQTIFQWRKNLVLNLLKFYPISKAIIERVRCTNFQQKGWTQVHQGQSMFINFVKNVISQVNITRGYITKRKRISLFGEDPKVKNKASKSFEAHAVDSFSIACLGMVYNLKGLKHFTKLTKFISSLNFIRRELYKFKNLVKESKEYFRYGSKGKKLIFIKRSKLKKIRVKISDKQGNHGPWNYMYTKVTNCLKKSRFKYGGTIIYGQSRKRGLVGSTNSKYQNIFNSWIRVNVEII